MCLQALPSEGRVAILNRIADALKANEEEILKGAHQIRVAVSIMCRSPLPVYGQHKALRVSSSGTSRAAAGRLAALPCHPPTANAEDLATAEKANTAAPLMGRLKLTSEKLAQLARARTVALSSQHVGVSAVSQMSSDTFVSARICVSVTRGPYPCIRSAQRVSARSRSRRSRSGGCSPAPRLPTGSSCAASPVRFASFVSFALAFRVIPSLFQASEDASRRLRCCGRGAHARFRLAYPFPPVATRYDVAHSKQQDLTECAAHCPCVASSSPSRRAPRHLRVPPGRPPANRRPRHPQRKRRGTAPAALSRDLPSVLPPFRSRAAPSCVAPLRPFAIWFLGPFAGGAPFALACSGIWRPAAAIGRAAAPPQSALSDPRFLPRPPLCPRPDSEGRQGGGPQQRHPPLRHPGTQEINHLKMHPLLPSPLPHRACFPSPSPLSLLPTSFLTTHLLTAPLTPPPPNPKTKTTPARHRRPGAVLPRRRAPRPRGPRHLPRRHLRPAPPRRRDRPRHPAREQHPRQEHQGGYITHLSTHIFTHLYYFSIRLSTDMPACPCTHP